MPERTATVERRTKETEISVKLDLDGSGKSSIRTPLPFLTHMLEQLARHGALDLSIDADGDVQVDGHHTTEDLGIVIGEGLRQALGDRSGIRRFASCTIPMDETLVSVTLDLSGRPFLVWKVPMPKAKIGDWDSELAEVFFEAISRACGMNLHVVLHHGENLHHIVEAAFKALAQALRSAVARDPRAAGIPSTKGVLV